MASVNKVIIIGNLGKDPELTYTPSGSAICKLVVATTEKWKGKDGQLQEKTEWHRITIWGKNAENAGKYLAKGRGVYIEGRLETQSWDDAKTGEKKYSTGIVANEVQYLPNGGGKGKTDASTEYSSEGGDDAFGSHNTSSLDDIPF